MKTISILGSTGSIGVQALDVISEHSDLFMVEVLTANNNSALLIKQAKKFNPKVVVIANKKKHKEICDALFSLDINKSPNNVKIDIKKENKLITKILFKSK